MRTLFGTVNETKDLGAVAEHCPHCNALRCCLLRTVTQGHYICFAKITDPLRQSSCLCTDCLTPFSGKPRWSYAEVVPLRDARGMDLNELLTKTNPILADRIHLKETTGELGGDKRFTVAYENVEGMRPGSLHADLLRKLMEWPRLSELERDELEEEIGSLSRAWRFASEMAIGFPKSSGSVAFFLSAPIFGLILIGTLVTRKWLWGGLLLAASVIIAAALESLLLTRSVRKWTLQALVPEAQKANVDLDRFAAVVDDIPSTKRGLTEDLWPMKDQLDNIRATLIKKSITHAGTSSTRV